MFLIRITDINSILSIFLILEDKLTLQKVH
jgi:hypothetical protein